MEITIFFYLTSVRKKSYKFIKDIKTLFRNLSQLLLFYTVQIRDAHKNRIKFKP